MNKKALIKIRIYVIKILKNKISDEDQINNECQNCTQIVC